MDIFAERFKELKAKKGCTYKEIADYLGLKLRIVQFYAAGEYKPDYYGLVKLADFFGCSVDFLVGRTDNPKINL